MRIYKEGVSNGIDYDYSGGEWDSPGNGTLSKYFLEKAKKEIKSRGLKTQEKNKMVNVPEARNRPKFSKKMGNLSISIWENQKMINGNQVMVLSSQMEKRYLDKKDMTGGPNGTWKGMKIFLNSNELPKMANLCDWAFDQIYTKEELEEGANI